MIYRDWATGRRSCSFVANNFSPVGHQNRSCHTFELTRTRGRRNGRRRKSDTQKRYRCKLFRFDHAFYYFSYCSSNERGEPSDWRRFPRSIDHAANRAYRLDFGSLIEGRRGGARRSEERQIALRVSRWIDNSWFHNCQSSTVNPFPVWNILLRLPCLLGEIYVSA